MNDGWTPELESTLRAWLREREQERCPNCGIRMGRHDVHWGVAGQTEAGTEYDAVRVVCHACDWELAYASDWGIPDAEAAVAVLQGTE